MAEYGDGGRTQPPRLHLEKLAVQLRDYEVHPRLHARWETFGSDATVQIQP